MAGSTLDKTAENAESPNGIAMQQSHDAGNLDDFDPSLWSFLSSLNAKEIPGPRGRLTFVLQPNTYAKTLESLRESDPDTWDYVNLKLRHDIIGDKYLVIKMVTPIHEIVTRMISDSIKEQLVTIKKTSNEPTKQLIQKIREVCSASIKLYWSRGTLQPDSQFRVKGCYYPGVVIEMAYSQSFRSLRAKARNLIVGSDGNIQIVIGLEAENGGAYKISAWRPDFIQSEEGNTVRLGTVIEQDIIRDVDGKLRPGSMTFQLRDFGSNLAATFPNANLTASITLRYNDLVDYLVDAEEIQNQEQPPGPNNIGDVGESSAEELTSEDEKEFLHLENKSAARSEAFDPDY